LFQFYMVKSALEGMSKSALDGMSKS